MDKIAMADFARRAITKCRKDGYKGLHTRFSGFNAAWKEYYGTDPVAGVNALIAEGKLAGHPAKGGFTIYLPEDRAPKSVQVALDKILAD